MTPGASHFTQLFEGTCTSRIICLVLCHVLASWYISARKSIGVHAINHGVSTCKPISDLLNPITSTRMNDILLYLFTSFFRLSHTCFILLVIFSASFFLLSDVHYPVSPSFFLFICFFFPLFFPSICFLAFLYSRWKILNHPNKCLEEWPAGQNRTFPSWTHPHNTWRSSASILLDIRSHIDRCNLGALPDGSALCGPTSWG